ncbi:MAG: preprotein translocase subunit SecE [Alphaproteobacteria bacterium]|nr:preprotein translocase subunit SecE [Alphaproteobacteria bacterium]
MQKIVEFGREVKREAQKITWPSRKETMVTTVMIVVMAVLVAIFFFFVDKLIGSFITYILGL